MNVTSQLLHQIADPTLTDSERARLRCRLAKEYEDSGNYEAAREAMGELWRGVGHRPVLNELNQKTAAEVLLRAGVLTGWIGSVKQIEGAQETAKNLISESISGFDALQDTERIAEAQTDLAYCYWRQGEFDEARVLLREALSWLTDTNSETKTVALLRSAIVERTAKRFTDALRILSEAVPLIEESNNHTLKGNFYNQLGLVLRNLSSLENHRDYIDRALIEYAAASFHFEQAGHTRYQGCVENNLGFLFGTIKRFPEAHHHLDHAQALFTSLKDNLRIAGVDETRARVFLAEGRISEAEKLARSAVQMLESGGQQSLLAEALTTHGIALARMGHHQQAQHILKSAVEVAQHAGNSEDAGLAALTIIEELGEHLTADDLSMTYECAADLLAASRDPGNKDRLLTCAHRVLFLSGVLPAPPTWKNFSLKDALRRYEARIIERALKDAGKSVTRAAHMLGYKDHTSLIRKLNKWHLHLLDERTPVVPRKSSLMFINDIGKETQTVTILHVEDRPVVANVVRETLEDEGWVIEMCADGVAALEKVASAAHYDLLLFDNWLPGMSGVELIRQTRALERHRQTPIIMFSGSDVEMEARRAGANAFLRKPQDISELAKTIARLLARKSRQH